MCFIFVSSLLTAAVTGCDNNIIITTLFPPPPLSRLAARSVNHSPTAVVPSPCDYNRRHNLHLVVAAAIAQPTSSHAPSSAVTCVPVRVPRATTAAASTAAAVLQ